MSKKRELISIVVPTYNEEGNIAVLYAELATTLKNENFEIIYVNDGSSDASLVNIKELVQLHNNVRYISFSRNFGHQAALRAGLRAAKGQAVISMDADLQHPPKLLPVLLEKWREGYQVVYTIRKDTNDTGFFKRATSSFFYKVLNFLSGLHMEEGAADFRLLDRQIVSLVNDQTEADIFLRGYISWLGFRQVGIDYEPAKRFSGKSKYSLKRLLSLAGKGVTQFSIKPLRLAHVMAFAAFVISFIYLVYAAIVAFTGHGVPGWLSLVVLFVFMQGVQFLLLGLIGEYLGRTFMQTKNRPEFIIAETNELEHEQ
jgi:dolichol-phosphate mannosyltransferase